MTFFNNTFGMKTLTKDNFNEETKSGVALVDFWATWCGFCQRQMPILGKLHEKMGNKVNFLTVNVEEQEELAKQFEITGIPAMFVMKDGKVVDFIGGLHAGEEIEATLNKYL